MDLGARTILTLIVNVSWAVATVAQYGSAAAQSGPVYCGRNIGPISSTMHAVRGAPYSALREYSETRTLADGTHITNKPRSEKLFRDSQGRTRSEQPLCGGRLADLPDADAVLVYIQDPVSGSVYILDAQKHIAHRYALRVSEQSQPRPFTGTSVATVLNGTQFKARTTGPQSPNAPGETTEPLPAQTVDGLMAEGTRTTQVIPEGAEGNDRPITVVREIWFSPYIGLPILAKVSDPRTGETVARITSLDTSEPSPLLFQPPPDYKIVDTDVPADIMYNSRNSAP